MSITLRSSNPGPGKRVGSTRLLPFLLVALTIPLLAGCFGGGSKERKAALTTTSAKSESTPSGEPPSQGGPVVQSGGSVDKPGAAHRAAGKPIAGRYIVTLNPGENPRSVLAIAQVTPTYVYEDALNGFAAALNDGQLNALRHNKAVQAIEADQKVTGDAYLTETVDNGGQPWGLDRIDQPTGLSRTYSYWSSGSYGAGTGVRAYVIDSGIATADTDFGGRATNVYDATGGNGQDCNGHGTHVAGSIGGYRYGVAKSVQLRGVRVLGCDNRGSTSALIAGVDWVRANAAKPAVANISIEAPYSSAVNTAVANLVNSGVFVAVAAGNGNQDACSVSPASAAGTVTVGATDSADVRVSYSNYGACMDVYAPGYNVKSDWLNGATNTISGTSMATPHVTGVGALLKSDYGDQVSSTIAYWILNNAKTNVVSSNISGTANRLLFMSGW